MNSYLQKPESRLALKEREILILAILLLTAIAALTYTPQTDRIELPTYEYKHMHSISQTYTPQNILKPFKSQQRGMTHR